MQLTTSVCRASMLYCATEGEERRSIKNKRATGLQANALVRSWVIKGDRALPATRPDMLAIIAAQQQHQLSQQAGGGNVRKLSYASE
jgi:hypothetical protein